MKIIKNFHFWKAKRGLSKILFRLLLFSGILTILCLYLISYNSKVFFSFKSYKLITKNVEEKGELQFNDKQKVSLKNSYQAHEKSIAKKSSIQLKGKIEGEIDDTLKPLIKSERYFVEIDLNETAFCPRNFVPQYPIVLRRFVYFMPHSALFNGQNWEISACNGDFICDYSLTLKEEKRVVNMNCSGKIENNDIVVTGALKINGSFNGFDKTVLEITSENEELLSSWNFLEEVVSN